MCPPLPAGARDWVAVRLARRDVPLALREGKLGHQMILPRNRRRQHSYARCTSRPRGGILGLAERCRVPIRVPFLGFRSPAISQVHRITDCAHWSSAGPHDHCHDACEVATRLEWVPRDKDNCSCGPQRTPGVGSDGTPTRPSHQNPHYPHCFRHQRHSTVVQYTNDPGLRSKA